jgi:uncharacterized iron-regulated protein
MKLLFMRSSARTSGAQRCGAGHRGGTVPAPPDDDFTRVARLRQSSSRLVERLSIAFLACAAAATSAAATQVPPEADAIAHFVKPRRILLLGEIHDNDRHHALRADIVAKLVAGGARPALAFEQFDTERQADIDRARAEKPRDADHLIAQAKGRGSWRWDAYRPLIAIALQHDLPIVAANLSRSRAMKVATEGWPALFDAATTSALEPEALPADYLRKHEAAIARGHCDQLPASALPSLARAQIARDIVITQAVRPHFARGVVLIAGNGHVRTDIGVPFWLAPEERAASVSVALIESGDVEPSEAPKLPFDAFAVTPAAERPDPCRDVPKHLPSGPATSPARRDSAHAGD